MKQYELKTNDQLIQFEIWTHFGNFAVFHGTGQKFQTYKCHAFEKHIPVVKLRAIYRSWLEDGAKPVK